MSEFDDLLNGGMSEMMGQSKTRFTYAGKDYHAIHGGTSEGFSLEDGGFSEEVGEQLIVPFTEGMPEPRHDAKVTLHFTKPTVRAESRKIGRPIQSDEVSWILNLISAK